MCSYVEVYKSIKDFLELECKLLRHDLFKVYT